MTHHHADLCRHLDSCSWDVQDEHDNFGSGGSEAPCVPPRATDAKPGRAPAASITSDAGSSPSVGSSSTGVSFSEGRAARRQFRPSDPFAGPETGDEAVVPGPGSDREPAGAGTRPEFGVEGPGAAAHQHQLSENGRQAGEAS